MPMTQPDILAFFESLSPMLAHSPLVGESERVNDMLVYHAEGTADSVHYRVRVEDDRVWVSLVTGDRWLSESIEADLMNTGDKLEELIEDELADLGAQASSVSFEHFRSDEMLFTFQSPLDIPAGGLSEVVQSTADMLLAYVACFAQLGDVIADDSDD